MRVAIYISGLGNIECFYCVFVRKFDNLQHNLYTKILLFEQMELSRKHFRLIIFITFDVDY